MPGQRKKKSLAGDSEEPVSPKITAKTAPENGDRPKLVTLADVARRARFGESTVSRALRNDGSVARASREKILKAADDLNYVSNRIAGTLASAKSKFIGIIIPSVANTVVPEVLAGAMLVLEDAGFQPVIGVSNYDANREEKLIKSLLSWRPAGMMVAGLEHTEHARAMLMRSGVRVVELLDVDGEGIDIVVGTSHFMAGRKSAEHLLARNYRRIGYVGHDIKSDERARKRLEGFQSVLRENGLNFLDQYFFPDCVTSVEAGKIGLACLLKRQRSLDAIYFSTDQLAVGGYFYCLERNISVPTNLALFGYNGTEITRSMPQPLSTIRTPRIAIGNIGANLLLSDGPSTVVDMGFELIVGATS